VFGPSLTVFQFSRLIGTAKSSVKKLMSREIQRLNPVTNLANC
jgi:hypothetical protein